MMFVPMNKLKINRARSWIGFLILAVTLLGGCCAVDVNHAMNYCYAKWASKYPQAWFVVLPLNYGQNWEADEMRSPYPKGKMTINGQEVNVMFAFGDDWLTIYEDSGNDKKQTGHSESLFEGRCEYSADKFIMNITKDRDNLFGESLDEMIFLRESYMPEEGRATLNATEGVR